MEFCTQLGKLGPHESPCPLDEWTLCLFVTHLTQSVRPATIKVYLSAVRALHIEQSFSDPLVDCLRLQRVARGIKRFVGEARSMRLPVTDQTLLLVFISASTITLCFGRRAIWPILVFFARQSSLCLIWAVSPQTAI